MESYISSDRLRIMLANRPVSNATQHMANSHISIHAYSYEYTYWYRQVCCGEEGCVEVVCNQAHICFLEMVFVHEVYMCVWGWVCVCPQGHK